MRIWVDTTSAPHPVVLRPVISRLEDAGHEVLVTARAFGQTKGMLERLGIPHEVIGRHGGGSAAGKAAALASRSAELWRWARRRRPGVGLAHGSVDLAVVCGGLRVPSVQMQDYEFAGLQRQIAFRLALRVIAPDAIPLDRLRRIGAPARKLFSYPGLKEDYYLFDFEPDAAALEELGVDRGRILAIVRPPDETSAYRSRNPLYERVLDRLQRDPQTTTVVFPRSDDQRRRLQARAGTSFIVPERVVDAQSLIAYADLVVSGGGTMIREAAALGTPAYTIFSGRVGGVDESLIAAGRLRTLSEPGDIELRKRDADLGVRTPRDPALLVSAVLDAATRTLDGS
jgi:predicted glycosyltransferase